MSLLFEPKWKSYTAQTLEPVLTPQQCDEVIRLGQTAPDQAGQVGQDVLEKSSDSYSPAGTFDKKKRLCTISWIPFSQANEMYRKIEGWVVNTNNNHFGFDGVKITELAQYTEYPTGAVCPNDFEGGELELIDSKKQPDLKRGYAVFFASFIRHRIKPVTKGNRKSLVMWFGGPPFR